MTDIADAEDMRQMLVVMAREILSGRDPTEIARIALKRFGGIGEAVAAPDLPRELDEVPA